MNATANQGYQLRLPALEVAQGERRLYAMAVDGKVVPSFAAVSRIHRAGDELKGYQRPEVVSHIAEIRRFLETPSPLLPNAVVLAFDPRVRFQPGPEANFDALGSSRAGTLIIPVRPGWLEEEKPGLVVDGQQRLAAISGARVERFPVCVTAFITSDVKEQTEQFLLVNSAKPLPKSLIYELLPHTQVTLPGTLRRRRFPAYLAEQLNLHERSPLRGMLRTQTTPEGVIKDNSILKMLENSLNDGLLYRFRSRDGSGGDLPKMLKTLFAFWTAVSAAFPAAWGLPPRRSRLLHGAGVVALGFVMDWVGDKVPDAVPDAGAFAPTLARLTAGCCWTEGTWTFSDGQRRRWDDIQNTSRDVDLLTRELLRRCRETYLVTAVG